MLFPDTLCDDVSSAWELPTAPQETADTLPKYITLNREPTALSSSFEDTLVQMGLVSTCGRMSGSRR